VLNAGYKDTHTLRNQACKLRRECADEITDELHRNFAEIAVFGKAFMLYLRKLHTGQSPNIVILQKIEKGIATYSKGDITTTLEIR